MIGATITEITNPSVFDSIFGPLVLPGKKTKENNSVITISANKIRAANCIPEKDENIVIVFWIC